MEFFSQHYREEENPFDVEGMSLREVIAGSVAGFTEHIGMFPFDTIKTRMQSEGQSFRTVVSHMLRNERWAHLYRGCAPVLCSAVPAHGAYFSIYEAMKRRLRGRVPPVVDNSSNTTSTSSSSSSAAVEGELTHHIIIAAATATLAHDAVSIPFDVVKQRMQIDREDRFRNSWHCFKTVVRREGFSALFLSLPTTTLMNIPHVATQWVVYERLKRFLALQGEEENELAIHYVASGLVAGACAATVSTPLDNVKTRLQLGVSHTFRRAVAEIYKQRGLRGFWQGVIPRIFNMAPSAALTLATFELVKTSLTFLDD